MNKKAKSSGRRNFLKQSAATASVVVGGATAKMAAAQSGDVGFLAVDPWTKTQGSGFINPPYGVPSKYEKGVVRVLPSPVPAFPTASRTPLQSMHGIITPNGLVFERHHAGIPDINPDLQIGRAHV